MTGEPTPVIEMFSAGFFRWHVCVIFHDKGVLRTNRPVFGHHRARAKASEIANAYRGTR